MVEINKLKYHGYTGTVEWSSDDGLYFGQVIGIRGLISYEGITKDELREDFEGAIDDYLINCERCDVTPE